MVKLFKEDIQTGEVLDWKGVHLFHFSGSSCSQKSRIFLNLKGIDWTGHHIDLMRQENYEPHFLGLNPRGQVPVLVHDGDVHIESNDILAYLDETFPKPGLIPAEQREEMLAALREEDDLAEDIRVLTMRYMVPGFLMKKGPDTLRKLEENQGTIEGKADPQKEGKLGFWRAFAEHGGITDEQVRTAAARLQTACEKLEKRLDKHPYLAGKELTLLDIAWFIYVFRLGVAGYPLARLHPKLHQWHRGLMEREEFAKEVAMPGALRAITAVLHAVQKVRGSGLEAVAGL